MDRRKLASIVFLLAAIILFISGVVRLFVMRFDGGDVYPAYSSYRSDPLGARALYEGLGLLPGVKSLRNTEPLARRSGQNDAALFLIGVKSGTFCAMDAPSVEAIEKGAQAGGRIIMTFAPEQGKSSPAAPSPTSFDLRSRWHLDIHPLPEQHGPALLSTAGGQLPPSIDWHSAMAFEPKDAGWRTIYARDGRPVLMERKMGKGEIVLASDSFFLSNEAMKDRRYPYLLVWLCGEHRRIVFDETHLGISKSPGIAGLLRRHGLTPFFVSLIVLVMLAIWRQSAPFVPPAHQDERPAADPGRTYGAGMTNLLRRNIPPGDVLIACLDEWERSFTRGVDNLASLTPGIREIVFADRARPKRMRNPAEAYRRISALVAARRRGEKK